MKMFESKNCFKPSSKLKNYAQKFLPMNFAFGYGDFQIFFAIALSEDVFT